MSTEPVFELIEIGFYITATLILALSVPCHIALFVLLPLALKCHSKLSSGVCWSSRRLDGKTIIVTGANAGIGFETAKDLARRGSRVILGCRNLAKGTAALEKIKAETKSSNVVLKQVDLASLASVRKFCKEVNAEESRLDILVNNAGLILEKRVITVDKLETVMQANHFGPFLLTNLLLDLMKRSGGGRIVNVGSEAQRYTKFYGFDVEDLNLEGSWAPFKVYSWSKLANVLFTKELSRRLTAAGLGSITVNALHPGAVKTNLGDSDGVPIYKKILKSMLFFFFKTGLEGAQTSIHVAVSEEVNEVTGEYYSDCKISGALSTHALNPILAKKLWEKSVVAVGLMPEETVVWAV